MNAPRTIASIVLALITLGVVAMLAMAVYPAMNGGLSVDTDISFTGPTLDENMNITVETSKPLTIKSDLPYDLTRIEVSAYMDMGDGITVVLVDTEELTVKKGESVSIPLSFSIPPEKSMEVSAWTLAYNTGSATGFKVPMVMHIQGYYFDGMLGGSVDVGVDLNLSPNGKVTVTTANESQIKGTLSDLGSNMMSFLPASGTASICGADGVSVFDCTFAKNGASVDVDSKTVDGKGIVETLKACAEANDGKLLLKADVAGYGAESYSLTAEETDDLIDAVSAAVKETLEVTA